MIEKFMESSFYLDYESAEIQDFIQEFKHKDFSQKEIAVKLYHKIRDQYWYNPYRLGLKPKHYVASNLVNQKDGHCISKSIVLVACLRAFDIPARLHLAKVKNHIGVERLMEKFGTNELTPHGMVDLMLDGKWLKVSPAFNIELCQKCNVAPLDFDGETDSVFHEFDNNGNLFMEYLEDYGHFEDVPLEFIFSNLEEHYPGFKESTKNMEELIVS